MAGLEAHDAPQLFIDIRPTLDLLSKAAQNNVQYAVLYCVIHVDYAREIGTNTIDRVRILDRPLCPWNRNLPGKYLGSSHKVKPTVQDV